MLEELQALKVKWFDMEMERRKCLLAAQQIEVAQAQCSKEMEKLSLKLDRAEVSKTQTVE